MNTILIIDPALTFVKYLSLVLTRMGYKIVHAPDAEKALEIIKKHKFNLLICETKLPGMGGLEFCEIVKSRPEISDIPLILISIDGTLETKQAAQKLGCADYKTKPLTVHALHELMQKHLRYNSKRRKLRANMILSATINDGVRTLVLKATCLGEEGMFLEQTTPYPIGTLLDIVLPLPSLNNPLELKGEVVYVIDSSQQNLPPGMGIKFEDLTRNISTQLTSYIESFLSDSRPLSSPVTDEGTGNFLSSIAIT